MKMNTTNKIFIPQRGHSRSASLENPNGIMGTNMNSLSAYGYTGTLKSKNEQKRLRNTFGSQSNLQEYYNQHKIKFQNLKKMFEEKSDPCNRITKESFDQTSYTGGNLEKKVNDGPHEFSKNDVQNDNLIKPIPFKPIPFEPDYNIPNRNINNFCDRYGSTPSLAPLHTAQLKFGSTCDLRSCYRVCNSFARRCSSRSLKVNDSLESVRRTPDSDSTGLSNNMKFINKSSQEQFDITPSPSDSGISELEAALRERDSELSYLRQTMEHNEKVIFRVHKDKETYWEQQVNKLKNYFENQQKEYLLKIKKLEQMLTLQSFQFKQNKIRLSDDTNKMKDHYELLKKENELIRNQILELRKTESTLKERIKKLEVSTNTMENLNEKLKSQLEETDWTVCEKNGEISLLKAQLKELKSDLSTKNQELVHIRAEVNSKEKFEQKHNIENELETSQLNRIIILKDQVILGLLRQLSSLRKDLPNFNTINYQDIKECQKFSHTELELDNSTSCNPNHTNLNTEKGALLNNSQPSLPAIDQNSINNFLNKCNIDSKENVFNSCTKIEENCNLGQYNINLPDVTKNQKNEGNDNEVTDEIEEIKSVKHQLETIRKTFETERQRWMEEKDKVMKYQQTLQTHYVVMYKKMQILENRLLQKQ